MYEIFTLVHSEKKLVAFLLKHCIRIHQWLYFNLKYEAAIECIHSMV